MSSKHHISRRARQVQRQIRAFPGVDANLFIKTTLVLLLTLQSPAAEAQEQIVSDSELGFTLKLSSEFIPRPDIVGSQVAHAFQFGEGPEGETAVALVITKVGNRIGRERLQMKDMPPGFTGNLFVAKWQGFEINGFEHSEARDGAEVVNYTVLVPLKNEGIQVTLSGTTEHKETLKRLLGEVLEHLDGKSSWQPSAAPLDVPGPNRYGVLLLWIWAGSVITGLVALWWVSTWAPKGTVLVISAVIYWFSWQLDSIKVREIRMVCGATRMLGFAGGLLGIVDVIRKRKPKVVVEQATAQDRIHAE